MVRGDTLLGYIVAVYEDEPYAHMIPIQDFFSALNDTYMVNSGSSDAAHLPNGAVISLSGGSVDSTGGRACAPKMQSSLPVVSDEVHMHALMLSRRQHMSDSPSSSRHIPGTVDPEPSLQTGEFGCSASAAAFCLQEQVRRQDEKKKTGRRLRSMFKLSKVWLWDVWYYWKYWFQNLSRYRAAASRRAMDLPDGFESSLYPEEAYLYDPPGQTAQVRHNLPRRRRFDSLMHGFVTFSAYLPVLCAIGSIVVSAVQVKGDQLMSKSSRARVILWAVVLAFQAALFITSCCTRPAQNILVARVAVVVVGLYVESQIRMFM